MLGRGRAVNSEARSTSSLQTNSGWHQMRLKPIILSGGSGTRLWPLSRASLPKQFLNLRGDRSLLQYCLESVSSRTHFEEPDIICNADHRFIVEEHIRASHVPVSRIILEPTGRNTGPAIALSAALAAQADPRSILVVLPSDSWFGDVKSLIQAIESAAATATLGNITMLGIEPSRADTGFGYIEIGPTLPATPNAFSVASFTEKPSLREAEQLAESGNHLWNCGIFVFAAGVCQEAVKRTQPALAIGAKEALETASDDGRIMTLDEEVFGRIPSLSFDKSVLEKTENLAAIKVSTEWEDMGSWSAVSGISPPDKTGNKCIGKVIALDVSGSYLRSEKPLLAALGVKDVLVVATEDAVLVADANSSQNVRHLVDLMEQQGYSEHLLDKTIYRPWGHYKELEHGPGYRVKLVEVNPGGSLSLQRHTHRSEHWVVIQGTAEVTKDRETITLHENESTFIPMRTIHRLENKTQVPLQIIEVQTGEILEESDIERFSDIYGRTD